MSSSSAAPGGSGSDGGASASPPSVLSPSTSGSRRGVLETVNKDLLVAVDDGRSADEALKRKINAASALLEHKQAPATSPKAPLDEDLANRLNQSQGALAAGSLLAGLSSNKRPGRPGYNAAAGDAAPMPALFGAGNKGLGSMVNTASSSTTSGGAGAAAGYENKTAPSSTNSEQPKPMLGRRNSGVDITDLLDWTNKQDQAENGGASIKAQAEPADAAPAPMKKTGSRIFKKLDPDGGRNGGMTMGEKDVPGAGEKGAPLSPFSGSSGPLGAANTATTGATTTTTNGNGNKNGTIPAASGGTTGAESSKGASNEELISGGALGRWTYITNLIGAGILRGKRKMSMTYGQQNNTSSPKEVDTLRQSKHLSAHDEKTSEEQAVEKRQFYKTGLDVTKRTKILAHSLAQTEIEKEREEAELLGRDEWQLWNQKWREGRTGWLGYVPIFHPDANARVAWQVLMVFPLMYMGTVVPFRLAFVDFRIYPDDPMFNVESVSENSFWAGCDLVLDISFWLDLFFNFFVAYFDYRGILHTHPTDIWHAYLTGWFTMDLLACLPAEFYAVFIAMGSDTNANKITRLPQLYRIGRLARLGKMGKVKTFSQAFIRRLQQQPAIFYLSSTLGKSRLANVSKFLLVLLFIAHILGCFWYLSAAMESDPLQTWVGQRKQVNPDGEVTYMLEQGPTYQWLTCVYFILTVCTTVGFGDITPFTSGELVFVTALMLFGAVINSMIVSEVIAVLSRVDQSNQELSRKTASISSFFRRANVQDTAIENKIRKVAEYQTREKYAASGEETTDQWRAFWEICSSMSGSLQRVVAKRAFNGGVWNNQFVKHSKLQEEGVPLLLSIFLQKRMCERGFVFYRIGEQAQSLYFVLSGVLSFCAVPSEMGGIANVRMIENLVELDVGTGLVKRHPYTLFCRNGYVGEWELIVASSRKSCLRAETRSEILTLNRGDFIILCYSYPTILENLRGHARRREERRLLRFRKHTAPNDYKELAANTIRATWLEVKKRRAKAKMKRTFNKVHKIAARAVLGKSDRTALEMSKRKWRNARSARSTADATLLHQRHYLTCHG
ncbi:unnamed protein product [Amoebophrya sp. A25]|nr:unnamed protein product [Amoebophrya sp. A25]|eukprot:GSA25T00024412001.1